MHRSLAFAASIALATTAAAQEEGMLLPAQSLAARREREAQIQMSDDNPDPPGLIGDRLTGGRPSPAAHSGLGPEAPASRAASLRAVVRLRDHGALVCTSTLVRRGGAVGLLSAAHCFYRTMADGRLLGRRGPLVAEGIGAIAPDAVVLDRPFARCAESGVPWQDCVAGPGRDIAWIPLPSPPPDRAPWRVCADDPPRDVTIFGYGLNGRVLPRVLLQGSFRLRPADARRHLREAQGTGVRVDAGDSGGPVVSRDDAERLDLRAPCVRFVAVAVRLRDLGDPADRSRALLEPISADAP